MTLRTLRPKHSWDLSLRVCLNEGTSNWKDEDNNIQNFNVLEEDGVTQFTTEVVAFPPVEDLVQEEVCDQMADDHGRPEVDLDAQNFCQVFLDSFLG